MNVSLLSRNKMASISGRISVSRKLLYPGIDRIVIVYVVVSLFCGFIGSEDIRVTAIL